MATSFSALPRKHQLSIVYGVPAAIAVLIVYLTWRDLGALGKIDNEIDPSNRLPAMLQRNTPVSVWTDIRSTQGEIDAKQTIIDRGPAVKATLASLEADIKAYEERLPRETEKAEMREVIEKLARDIPKDIGTVELKSVRIVDDAGERNGNMRTITFQTDLTGDLDGILKYIDQLEKNQRFMSVSTLSIKGGAVTADLVGHKPIFAPHSVHMDIVTYVYNPGAKR